MNISKRDIVLAMAGGIFNLGKNFFGPIIPWFKAKGYEHFHVINYPLRNVRFNQYDKEKLQRLGDCHLLHDFIFLERELSNLKKRNNGKRIILLAHSKSGALGQILAQYSIFDGLVALCPAPPRGISALSFSGFWNMKSVLAQIIRSRSTKIPVRRSFPDTLKGAFHPAMNASEQEHAYNELVWESGRIIWELAFDRFLHRKELESTLFVDEQKVEIPLLFIGGSLDKIIKARTVQKIAKKFGTEAVIFKEVAHYPFWGKPGLEVLDAIDGWISAKYLA